MEDFVVTPLADFTSTGQKNGAPVEWVKVNRN